MWNYLPFSMNKRITLQKLKKLIQEAIRSGITQSSGKRKTEKQKEKLGIPVNGSQVEGVHDIDFGPYSVAVMVHLEHDKASLIAYMDKFIANEADINNDPILMFQMEKAVENFVGFPISWVDRWFMSTHNGSVRRMAVSAAKLAISYPDE